MNLESSVNSYNSLVDYAVGILKDANILEENINYISFSIDEKKYIYCKLDVEKEYDIEIIDNKYHELYNKINIWKQIIDLLKRVKEFKKTPSIMSNEEARIFKLEEALVEDFYQIEDLTKYEDEYLRLLKVLQQLDILHNENEDEYE